MEQKYNTLEYYNKNAKIYCEQTLVGNLSENYERFLSRLPQKAYILDFGCGSGRDSKYFKDNGYKVKAIDGSLELCKLASKYINQEVICMNFDELDEQDTYDGIWACSSILHVEEEKLDNILIKMIKAVKANGIIYASFKIGEGHEIKEGKYYNYVTKPKMEEVLNNISKNVKIIDYFETLPSTKRKAQGTTWGILLYRKWENKFL